MKIIRNFILLAAAFIAFVATPAMALDPHYAGYSTVTNQSTLSSVANTTWTVTTLSPGTVNSGTNSFLITANVRFNAPLGNAVHVQLSKTVSSTTTIFSDTVQDITGEGNLTITYAVENIAASTTLNLAVVIDNANVPVKITRATLAAIGLAGNTQ